MELKTRAITVKDWDTLEYWWSQWEGWTPPPKDFLPNHGTGGFLVEKNEKPIVAGFVYFTNSKVAWVEWIVSDPEYREDDRKEALELLLTELETFIITMGYKYMSTIGRNKNLMETHKKLGWNMDKKPSYELTKNL